MLADKEVAKIKDALISHTKPFFLFHDDPDGLASFLLLYRFVKEGRGYVVKARPQITKDYVKKIEDYGADIVFILDIAMVDQEFIDAVKVPIYWIDHHPVLERENVNYFNPRKTVGNIPTPIMCYQIVQQDLWLTVTGCIGDWYWPTELVEEFRTKFPGLLPDEIKTVEQALLNSPLGKLIKLFSFNLKGTTNDVLQSIKTFTRIESPNEILKSETPRGKFLLKRYELINEQFEKLYSEAVKKKTDDKILLFTYHDDRL
ncbi:MAG: hypothetical protein AABX39_02810, partial [Nanoarchaeota archaeon]